MQAKPFVGAANLLRISFASNVRLHPGTSLIISGFKNTSLAAAVVLRVAAASAGSEAAAGAGEVGGERGGRGVGNESWIEGNVTWDAHQGRLVAILAKALEADRDYWFSVSIENPLAPRQAISAASVEALGVVSLRAFNMTLGRGNFAPLFATGERVLVTAFITAPPPSTAAPAPCITAPGGVVLIDS